jgi:hypothetical protein
MQAILQESRREAETGIISYPCLLQEEKKSHSKSVTKQLGLIITYCSISVLGIQLGPNSSRLYSQSCIPKTADSRLHSHGCTCGTENVVSSSTNCFVSS